MARIEKLSNPSLRRRRLAPCANDVISVMVAAPATASDLMNCRRDVVISIVVVLERKDGTRIELIATDFSGSIRGESVYICQIRAPIHFRNRGRWLTLREPSNFQRSQFNHNQH